MKVNAHHLERGFTMVEILVTIVIVSISLLGLAGLQSKLTVSQLESYQRAQGSVMLADMVARFNSARSIAADLATAAAGEEVGKGDESWLDCSSAATADKLLCQWSVLLKGSSEQRADGTKAGGPIGMVGCISSVPGSNPPAYMVSVAWQGNTLGYVPANLNCGLNKFGTEPATSDRLGYRRVVSQVVQLASLTGI